MLWPHFHNTSGAGGSGWRKEEEVSGRYMYEAERNGTCVCVFWREMRSITSAQPLTVRDVRLYTFVITITRWGRSLDFHFINGVRWGSELCGNFSEVQQGVNQERKPDLRTRILWFSQSPGCAPPSTNQAQEGRRKLRGKRQGELWVYAALLILI